MKTNRYILGICMAVLALFTLSCGQEEGFNQEKEMAENNPSGPYSFIASGGRSQTKGETPDTRATLDLTTYKYKWEPGDAVVLSITPKDQTTIVTGFNGIELLAMTQKATEHTNFMADLVQQQYENLTTTENARFDFYSFFPSNLEGWNSTSSTFPATLQFTMPNSYTIAANTFVQAKYAPMIAMVKDKEPEIFIPKDDVDLGTQIGGLHFNYEHILSYAAIEMDVKLMPENVTSITMTVGSGTNDATRINGNISYNLSDSSYTLSGGSNNVTVTIPNGGLTAGDGSAVYIPMPVKDLSGEKLTFTFNTGSSSNTYKSLTTATVCGINFERGKIHRIRVAPAAQYAAGTSFTVTKSGYYYIEAWGGDGGKGGRSYQNDTQTAGGVAQKVSGLYYLNAGTSFSLYIGSAGVSKPAGISAGSGAGATGGTNGLANGGGGSGGDGYRHPNTLFNGSQYSGAGGGGGAGTFVFAGGTSLPANLLIVSGGGGGSGGGSANSLGSYSIGGKGGNAGTGGSTSENGDQATNSGGQGATTFTDAPTGGNGTNGGKGGTSKAPGGGGGGGGGGYQFGGNGGFGGSDGGNANAKGGGGGKGGQSYIATQKPNPGYTLPSNDRPSSNGYVIITYFR
ncbi:hypothetical protein LJC38_02445 [Parabacteroides sp. OttesenSCG-928-K15]|nr:hypothetical protein [Parabacteroides sp. OttesenSCG-928-K15]